MRVAYLVAGAGGMYCGSCLRDNRLAATLMARGQDVVPIPLYTPIRTDETNVSEQRVFYGGLNVYLKQKAALFRHLPRWLERMLDAPALLRRLTQLAASTRPERLGALTVSVLQGEEGTQRKELAKLVDALRRLRPDLVSLPNLMFAGLAMPLKKAMKVPVLCNLTGEDLFVDQLAEPYRQQALDLIREGSGAIDGFVAFTEYYASHATKHFDLPADRVHVVPMGIRMDDIGEPASPSSPFTIGYLARVCPEKGLANLGDAFVLLRKAGRDCRLRAAGYLAPADRAYLNGIQERLRRNDAAGRFEYIGEVDRAGKFSFLRSLHLFSVPTVYQEAKGLYLIEAMACGVPVVQPRHGSFPEIVEATDGGLLYDPGQPQALADAIAMLIDNPSLRERCAHAGRSAVRNAFTDEVMADRAWRLYSTFAGRGV